jgi:hypothetical protein
MEGMAVAIQQCNDRNVAIDRATIAALNLYAPETVFAYVNETCPSNLNVCYRATADDPSRTDRRGRP